MKRHTHILLTLALSGLLVACVCGAPKWSASELADLLRNHINERLYNTCKAVVLQRQSEALYAGHAEFQNGVKVDLEVDVSEDRIEYAFVKPEPERADAESMPTQIQQLQAMITHQQIEIARLRDLCAHAGIDAEAIEANTVLITSEKADPPPVPRGPATSEQTKSESTPVWCTRPAYDEIRKGMTRAQVAKKLGADGKLIGNSDFDRALNETYIWANPDDSHACVVFRNGKVLVKTQFGLPTPGATRTDPPHPGDGERPIGQSLPRPGKKNCSFCRNARDLSRKAGRLLSPWNQGKSSPHCDRRGSHRIEDMEPSDPPKNSMGQNLMLHWSTLPGMGQRPIPTTGPLAQAFPA